MASRSSASRKLNRSIKSEGKAKQGHITSSNPRVSTASQGLIFPCYKLELSCARQFSAVLMRCWACWSLDWLIACSLLRSCCDHIEPSVPLHTSQVFKREEVKEKGTHACATDKSTRCSLLRCNTISASAGSGCQSELRSM